MVDRLTKFLRKQDKKTAELVNALLDDLKAGKLDGCDIKKLRGTKFLYRLRKGRIRIIFEKKGNKLFVIRVDYRNERTYDGINNK